MIENRTTPKQDISINLPRPSIPQNWVRIGLGAGILVYGLLLVGLFLAPELAVWGLVGIGIGIPLFLLIWNRPELGLLVLIFLTSSFVPANVVDVRLPIGGGLDLRDLVLIGMCGLLFMRELANKTISIPWWRVGGPLTLFLIMAVFSALYAIVFQHVEAHWALSDLRILFCYVTFFTVIWGIKRPSQLQVLLIGLFILADLTTTFVVLQQFAGANNPLLQAMMTTQDWQVYQEAGGVRVIPAGQILMHFMWFIALGLLIFTKLTPTKKAFLVSQILFIGVGHILTYMRAQWAAMFIGFGLICLVILPRYKSLLPKYLLLGLSVLVIMALLWSAIGLSSLIDNPVLSGLAERFASIFTPQDTMETSSLEWRQFENGKALASITRHPLLGVGLGGRYRELTTLQGEVLGLWSRGSLAADDVSRFTRYVHNSYLSITVKMGIPGLAAILWFIAALLLDGWRIYKNLPDSEYRGIVLGIIASFVGLLAWSYFHAHLIKAESTPVIALMAGLVAVVDSLYRRERYSPDYNSLSTK